MGDPNHETRQLEFSRQQRCQFPTRLLREMQGGPRMLTEIVVPLVENILRNFGDNCIPLGSKPTRADLWNTLRQAHGSP